MTRRLAEFDRTAMEAARIDPGWKRRAGHLVMENEERGILIPYLMWLDGDGKPLYDRPFIASRGGPMVIVLDNKGRIGLLKKWQGQPQSASKWRTLFPTISYAKLGRVSYELPGGMLEPGETIYEAAQRELWEETGIKVDDPLTAFKVLGNFCSDPPSILNLDTYLDVHIGKAPKKRVQNDDEGIAEFKFFRIKEIWKLIENGLLYDTRTIAGLIILSTMGKKRKTRK